MMFELLLSAFTIAALPAPSGPASVVAQDCVACASADLYEEFYRHSVPGLRPIVQHPYSFRIRGGTRVWVLDRNDRFRPAWLFVKDADGRRGVIRSDDVVTSELAGASGIRQECPASGASCHRP